MRPLKGILERLDKTSPSRSRKKVNALDGNIKEALWKFEDSLESLLTHHIPSQLETLPESLSIDLQSLENDANLLIQKLNDMKKEYIYEVENMPRGEPISSFIGFHGTNSKMIGLSDQFQLLKTDLMQIDRFYKGRKHGYALYGTAGVGKTTLAMQIYQDEEIQDRFECRAWVTVGRVPQPISQILRGILAQLCGIKQGEDEISDHCLTKRLYGKKCLVVLDDVWEKQVYDSLAGSLPNIKNGYIHVLHTGRHYKWMRQFSCYMSNKVYEVRFLNEEESMELLCEKVFGDEIALLNFSNLPSKLPSFVKASLS